MNTTRILASLLFLALLAPIRGAAGTLSLQFETSMPRAVSLSSQGTDLLPPVSLQFSYDAKGKTLISAGSTVGEEPLTGKAVLSKLVKGERTFVVTAKGATLKTVSLSIKGKVGSGYATCIYKTAAGRVAVTDLPITFDVQPVVASFTLSANVDAKGRITGSGTIQSGYGNDSTQPGILSGKFSPTTLTWKLTQGTQRLSFSGKKQDNNYVGTLVVGLPPASGTYKPFTIPASLDETGGGDRTTFKGSVSLAGLQAGMPEPGAGVRFTVSVDLDLNGTIESSERFQTLTDDKGKYSLTCAVPDGRKALVEVASEGYATQHQVVESVRPGATVSESFVLRPLQELTLSNSSATSSDGRLQLVGVPAEVARVQARVFNPATEAEQFPGAFADDRGNLLVSSVFSAIEARDADGNPVTDLGLGSTLKMQVPRDTWNTLKDLAAGNGQIDVPLYYFDEEDGQWKRSESDGWLENAAGTKLAEGMLASIRDGSYAETVFVAGVITHLSYWNLDWPIETHTCVRGVVVDASGNPVAGATVTVRGATYTGSSSPQVTGPDGSFCAQVMRSEGPGEDVDNNGVSGETHQVAVTVSYSLSIYNFGPYTVPASQATCGTGGCADLGLLGLAAENKLTVGLCTLSGKVVYPDGSPVAGANVFAYDETVEVDVWLEFYLQGGVSFFSATDQDGNFAMTVPILSGATVFVSSSSNPGNHTSVFGHAQAQVGRCPTQPIRMEIETWRSFDVLDSDPEDPEAETIGSIWQAQDGSASIFFSKGDLSFFAEPADGETLRVPADGQSVTYTLMIYDGSAAPRRGTITLTADSPIGGTWQTTGEALSGTWGN